MVEISVPQHFIDRFHELHEQVYKGQVEDLDAIWSFFDELAAYLRAPEGR